MFEDPFAFLAKIPAANDTGAEREPVQEIFMHLPKEGGEHIVRISLLADGSADLSDVPSYLKDSWEACGERTTSTRGPLVPSSVIMPQQGESFLRTLLKRSVGSSGVWFSVAGKTTHV